MGTKPESFAASNHKVWIAWNEQHRKINEAKRKFEKTVAYHITTNQDQFESVKVILYYGSISKPVQMLQLIPQNKHYYYCLDDNKFYKWLPTYEAEYPVVDSMNAEDYSYFLRDYNFMREFLRMGPGGACPPGAM